MNPAFRETAPNEDAAAFRSVWPGLCVRSFALIDSTNAEAKRLAASVSAPTLIVADAQTAGRGRLGRSFHSPAGGGAYFSFLLPAECFSGEFLAVTGMAAVAVIRAIDALAPGLKPGIKWVNDILSDGKKLCGILAEAVTDPAASRVTHVVIGIGANLHGAVFPPELQKIAGTLPASVERLPFIREVARQLYLLVGALPDRGYMADYRARSLVPGREILFTERGAAQSATAVSVTDEGALLVRLPDGSERLLRSGEITVRMTEQEK